MELILLVVGIAILVRVASLDAAATVSQAEFLQCLEGTEAPAVVEVHHHLLWLLGAARNRYILVFRGLRIHTRSFRPLELPPEVAVIQTRKL
ncbi:MAG: hypothetical protein WC709_12995 [Thermoleophilia bacterium]